MPKLKVTKTVVREVKKTRSKSATDLSKTSTNFAARLLPVVFALGFGFFAVLTETYILFAGTALCLVIAFLMHKRTPLTEKRYWKEDYVEKVPEEVTDLSATSTNIAAEALLWLATSGTIFVGYYLQIWPLMALGSAVCVSKVLMDYFPRAWKAVQILFVLSGLLAGLVYYLMTQ